MKCFTDLGHLILVGLILEMPVEMKSVGQADSHLLQPTQSSVLGEVAIVPALLLVADDISKTSVGQARTH